MILIGISGKKHSGKDTLYRYLKAYVPLIVTERIGFADALKEEVARAFCISVEVLEARKAQFRAILQAWGDGRREITSKTYWIDKVLHKLKESKADMVIIPDVRYKNELHMIKDVGGYSVRINRSLPESIDHHPSEIDLDNMEHEFDFCIDNNASIEHLQHSAKHILASIRNKIYNTSIT